MWATMSGQRCGGHGVVATVWGPHLCYTTMILHKKANWRSGVWSLRAEGLNPPVDAKRSLSLVFNVRMRAASVYVGIEEEHLPLPPPRQQQNFVALHFTHINCSHVHGWLLTAPCCPGMYTTGFWVCVHRDRFP